MKNKSVKIISIVAAVIVVIAVVVVLVILGAKNSAEKTSPDTTSQSQIKIDAKSVVDAIKVEGKDVVVENYPKRIVNVVVDEKDERLEVRENPETGVLNGVELTVLYSSETRDQKLVEFFDEIKKVIKACDSSISDERINGIIIRFKQSIPEGNISTTCTETEGVYSFSVSYFPDKAYFVVS